MRISWFVEGEGEGHICETEGELPKVGEEVYINDYRGKGQIQSRYVVKAAYHKVALSTFCFEETPLKGSTVEERFDSLCDLIAKEVRGVCIDLPKSGHVNYASQSGEVILTPAAVVFPSIPDLSGATL